METTATKSIHLTLEVQTTAIMTEVIEGELLKDKDKVMVISVEAKTLDINQFKTMIPVHCLGMEVILGANVDATDMVMPQVKARIVAKEEVTTITHKTTQGMKQT